MPLTPRRGLAALFVATVTALAGAPASADHTDPNEPLVPIVDLGPEARSTGEGTWEHIKNFGGTTGTDVKFFEVGEQIYVSGGQLGQAEPLIVGQRILKLTDPDGTVNPEFVADHGSAYCGDVTNVSGTTGLQHDVAIAGRASYAGYFQPGTKPRPQILIDSVDAVGRCHDKGPGGLEFVDISGIGTEGFEPREVHLTRHNGMSHTVTVDATRPWIVYNSNSEFGTDPAGDDNNPFGLGMAWIDVMDIRTCLNNTGTPLDVQRALCRPKVYRIPFEAGWAAQETEAGEKQQPSGCHDITARPGRIYCAALNSTIIFDVAGLTVAQGPDVPLPTDKRGDIKGTPLPCEVIDAVPAVGAATAAKVTNCVIEDPLANQADQTSAAARAVSAYNKLGRPAAAGWKYVSHVNHVGRNCRTPGRYNCNTNIVTPSREGVSVAHESDPSPDGRYMFVTDERGGGIVPPGATCVPSIDNPYGNGGFHVFDITKRDADGRVTYAQNTDGDKAVYVSPSQLASPTFCTIHVIEHIPDEQRIVAAWYSQGVKIIDYEIDAEGRFSFSEVASYTLLPNDIWVGEPFKIQDNADGTRTYYFVSNDIARGMDVFSWTGPTNKIDAAAGPPAPAPAPAPAPKPAPKPAPLPATGADYALLGLAAVLLPAALLVRRRLFRVA